MTAPRFVGAEVKRREDPRFIQGRACYLDDVTVPGMLHLAIQRSPHAHARIGGIETGAASCAPGVVAVVVGRDVRERVRTKPMAVVPLGARLPPREILPTEEVKYVGQAVAAVVAEDRYRARDGLDLIRVDYGPLPAVVDPMQALSEGAPRVHVGLPDNVMFQHHWEAGDVEGAFHRAHRVVRLHCVNQRIAPLPLEPRGCVVQPRADGMTIWISTQMPHRMRGLFAEVLSIPEGRIRVIAPDVGGAFGCKTELYDDEALAAVVALLLDRPVKWVETRSESFVATCHGRGQIHDAELALGSDGRFLGLRVRGMVDVGAFPESFTAGPPILTGRLITGAYHIPAVEFGVTGVFTNKTPLGAYRGAGRPEAAYIIERLADEAASVLGLDPSEIRRRNFIRSSAFPYTAPSGLTYDSGQYEKALDRALERLSYAEFRAEQARLRALGRYIGVGLSSFVETAGTGPSKVMAYPGFEYGEVRVEPSGGVTVITGLTSQGQGEETAFAQLVADEVGVPLGEVTVVHGDTAIVPLGCGAMGSRGVCVAGTAVYLAAQRIKAKIRQIVAHLLEAAPDDVVLDGGRWAVRGSPSRGMTVGEVARVAHRGSQLPPGCEPGLSAAQVFDPPDFTVPFGTYVAVVEVLRETGEVRLVRFVGVEDVGHILNPMLLEGQLHGGIAQGIGQALWEELVYDEAGQLLTGTLVDYAVPRADLLPYFELGCTVTPTSVNALGAKGAGEAGAVGAPQAVVNAVLDALAPFGIQDLDMPLRAETVWRAMQRANP